jgi:arylsulfatase A-like enzyme
MLSTYSPHKPAPVATRNKDTHGTTGAPRTPTYNAFGVNEPPWLQEFAERSPEKQAGDDRIWRRRAQSAESVADSVGAILYALRESGRAENTLVVISADNGYHLGHFRLPKGKRTPYAFDTVVPLVMLGPGITPGTRITAMTSAIDLAPTFTEIFGRTAPAWVDGRSLTPFITTGQAPVPWRTGVLSESLGESGPGDPDYQRGNPPRFDALRTEKWLYVEYEDGSRTLYDREADPYELVNLMPVADPALVAQLAAQTQALASCAGPQCRVADMLQVVGETPTPPTVAPSATPTPEPSPSPSG